MNFQEDNRCCPLENCCSKIIVKTYVKGQLGNYVKMTIYRFHPIYGIYNIKRLMFLNIALGRFVLV